MIELNFITGFLAIVGVYAFLKLFVCVAKSIGEWERRMIEDD